MSCWKSLLLLIAAGTCVVQSENLVCQQTYEASATINQISVQYSEGPWCITGDYFMKSTSEDKVIFPDEMKIALVQFNTTYFSKALQQTSMKKVRELAVIDSQITKLYLNPGLLNFLMNVTSTREIIIDSSFNYQLVKFTLQHVPLPAIPKYFNFLTDLKVLYLQDVQLQIVNVTDFSGLENLSSISIVESTLALFLIAKVNLPNLKTLDLSANHINDVPSNLRYLSSLEYLSLSKNRLSFVEMGHFNGLLNLKKLDLSHNKMQKIFTLESVYLPAFLELDISYCQLDHFCLHRLILPKLQTLNVEHNALSVVCHFPHRATKIELMASGNDNWSCRWLEQVQDYAVFIGKKDDVEDCSSRDDICCLENPHKVDKLEQIEKKVAVLGYQNKLIYEKLNQLVKV